MVGIVRQSVRQYLINKRKALAPETITTLSHRICKNLSRQDVYRHAKHIALYHPSNGEVSLDGIWRAAPMHGRYCYFPVCVGEHLCFTPATPATPFVKNKYGIPEPDVPFEDAIEPEELDLILMPLVAFDPFGVRIGMGKGFYDKTLSNISQQKHKPTVLGVAYQFQMQPYLSKQPWDVLLHGTVTESEVYWTNLSH